MTKQHNDCRAGSPNTPECGAIDNRALQNTKAEASTLLASIAHTRNIVDQQMEEYNALVAKLTAPYEATFKKLRADLDADEKALLSLMKKNKALLFGGVIDVVNLPQGSLIRNVGEKVSIPKTALLECERQGFKDVIKVLRSLDRDAIEKWPDAKLTLIGAERKPKEEFKYTIKKSEG